MQQVQQQLEALGEIRDLVQRSSKFLSLSGMAGISAGAVALVGALVAYQYFDLSFLGRGNEYEAAIYGDIVKWGLGYKEFLLLVGGVVAALSLILGFFFTWRKSKRLGLDMWDRASRLMLINLFIPLLAGGIFCLVLLRDGHILLIAPVTLIFYGLALLNASKYMVRDVHYLGLSEMALGLIALFYQGYGLDFWTLGFGVLHIVYGARIYLRHK